MRRILIYSTREGRQEYNDKELVAQMRKALASIFGYVGKMQSNSLYRIKHEYDTVQVSLTGQTYSGDASKSYVATKEFLLKTANEVTAQIQSLEDETFDYSKKQPLVSMCHTYTSRDIIVVNATYQPHVVCPSCDKLLTPNGLKNHLGGSTCVADTLQKQATDAGYERVSDSALMSAIRMGGIDHRMVPAKLDVWAPKWAIEAARLYRNGEYADISLSDFIKKMQ